jgi:3-deoxy-manno-octulosonate cytidylyltransferase (CMP-KDO synthetase)
MKTLVIIPSRLSATRLPGKPLLKINGLSMISHVFKKAEEANIGEVVVATENQEIFNDVKQNGGQAILTKNNHKTGTDRIYEALQKLDSSNIDLVMNLQGDEPLMNLEDIRNLNNQMIKNNFQLGTLASKIINEETYVNENIVKVITKENLNNENFPEAINFKRKILDQNVNIYHHLGIYCYKKETLKNFVSFSQSINEMKSNLEQLRALDNNIIINVALAKSSSIGVDTKEDFMAIKKIMEYKS